MIFQENVERYDESHIFKYFQEVAILIFALILNPSMTICPLLHWLSCDTDFIDDFHHLPLSAQQNYPSLFNIRLSTYSGLTLNQYGVASPCPDLNLIHYI